MNLSDFDHFRIDKRVKFKEEIVKGVNFVIINYMIADSHFWDIPLAMETRGHVFLKETGECVSMALPKILNVGEREDTHPDKVKNRFVECQEKRDGSMILPVLINDEIVFKTKKSFFSDVAILANQVCPDAVRAFCRRLLLANTTPIFEFNHPECRIVLDYGKEPVFTLLAMRNYKTRFFYPYDCMRSTLQNMDYDIPVVERYLGKTWESIASDVETMTDFEGYVLVLDDGKRVKIKTNWYKIQHKLNTEVRERDIAELVIDETLDDFISDITDPDKIEKIREIESKVVDEVSMLREKVETIAKELSGISIKDVAIFYSNHTLFSLIIREIKNQEPDYVRYWKKFFLPNYSIKALFNDSF